MKTKFLDWPRGLPTGESYSARSALRHFDAAALVRKRLPEIVSFSAVRSIYDPARKTAAKLWRSSGKGFTQTGGHKTPVQVFSAIFQKTQIFLA